MIKPPEGRVLSLHSVLSPEPLGLQIRSNEPRQSCVGVVIFRMKKQSASVCISHRPYESKGLF